MTRPSIVARASRVVAALVAGLVVAMTVAGCAAGPLTWDSSSDAKVYLMNNTTTLQFADGSTVDWNTNQGVVLASAPILTVPSDWAPFALPAPTKGAVDVIAFIAPKGSERTRSKWKLWGDASPLNGKGALLPAVWPGYLNNGDSKAVQNAGGTYSMGVAYLKDNDETVVSAYYTTITVDAGKGTWKFATPPQ